MSSITKMMSSNVRRVVLSLPTTSRARSYITFCSAWLVSICASDTLMIERPVCSASALISDVLPVPGGPCSSRPILCGKPPTAYLPSLFWKSESSFSSASFCGNQRASNVLCCESAYRLYRIRPPLSSGGFGFDGASTVVIVYIHRLLSFRRNISALYHSTASSMKASIRAAPSSAAQNSSNMQNCSDGPLPPPLPPLGGLLPLLPSCLY
mmetsp:Transcript_22399/g.38265  ORF Transcript_22399/g.38265 Transcript_22399/m.38265 type:complete len:210 (+) Transcript_22399:1022-1651(+)